MELRGGPGGGDVELRVQEEFDSRWSSRSASLTVAYKRVTRPSRSMPCTPESKLTFDVLSGEGRSATKQSPRAFAASATAREA